MRIVSVLYADEFDECDEFDEYEVNNMVHSFIELRNELMNELEKGTEQIRTELFVLALVDSISKTLINNKKSINNSSHNDFIMRRFMRCE